jgi:two-component system cell cycle response regulator
MWRDLIASSLEQAHDKVTEQATLLLELSIKDELTGLYNRRYFRERADHFYKQANRYQQPLSIMLGDIDFFKRINDTYGHAIGDDVLRTISSLLQTNLRETDLLARYGGEEFVIIFPETDLYSASELCERIRQTIEGHSWEEIAADLKVTMSMGINADTQLSDFEQMLINADEKLYQAKGNGRNQIVI